MVVSVGKIIGACWTACAVMTFGCLPLGFAIVHAGALPAVVRWALAVVVAGGLWLGPFAYGMYLSIWAVRNGDRRLLRRGITGTAQVLAVKRTGTVISAGEASWNAPRVYRYRLRVSIPGRQPYEADCSICAAGIRQGSTVNVAVSRRNRQRVTIDVGQGSKGGEAAPRLVPARGGAPAGPRDEAAGRAGDRGGTLPEGERLRMLAQLGRLRSEGVLTDAEFKAQKARILAE
jgi:hypothetical protein